MPRADPHQWISPSASGREGSGGVQLTSLTRLAAENSRRLQKVGSRAAREMPPYRKGGE